MTRIERHQNKKSTFRTFYFIYLGIIAIALFAVFLYVRGVMVEYERNDSSNYVKWLITDCSDQSELGIYLDEKNFSDNRFGDGAQRKTDFYAKANTAELTALPAEGNHSSQNPVYEISADGRPFMTIALREEGSTTKLGIMTLSNWEIDYAIMRECGTVGGQAINEEGSIDYTLELPENYTLSVDGIPCEGIAPSGTKDMEEFEYVAPYVNVPKSNVYELSTMYYEPVFTALSESLDEFSFAEQDDGTLVADVEFEASTEARELALSVCDPIGIGKLWSRFMTDDVGGPSHGLAIIRRECMLLDGTNLYSLATKWATNVDITFVSGHTLDSFTKEEAKNFIQYNDELFSCDVYFEKNMTLARGLGSRTDVFSNRMYFGKVNGQWYLLDMVTLDY